MLFPVLQSVLLWCRSRFLIEYHGLTLAKAMPPEASGPNGPIALQSRDSLCQLTCHNIHLDLLDPARPSSIAKGQNEAYDREDTEAREGNPQ